VGGAAMHHARPQLWAPSETAPPEREVQLRVKELYDKVDTSGRLQFEGKFITVPCVRTATLCVWSSGGCFWACEGLRP
jgi:hypothetical protein